jgi:hypothetical protein
MALAGTDPEAGRESCIDHHVPARTGSTNGEESKGSQKSEKRRKGRKSKKGKKCEVTNT